MFFLRYLTKGTLPLSRARNSNEIGSLPLRFYMRTPSVLEEEAAAVKKKPKKDPERIKQAQDFNNRRASYNRQVSELRRQYAEEVAQQQAADKAEREAMAREATRRRLERQRRKNIRSAHNAMKEKEKRERRERAFEKHLRREQVRREARNERFAAARQKVVDELEKEAPLWLTTPEEVEAAFTPEAEQLLWARRGGVLGVPNPSLDAHFWQNETHTWHVTKTYKSQRQLLLEEILEIAYEDANIDKSFWTPKRIAEIEDIESRARLRAEVQRAGKAELLRRQAQMITEQYQTDDGELPKKTPAPNLKVLANTEALEREGAKLMFSDPTRFFVFEDQRQLDEGGLHDASTDGMLEDGGVSKYSGPTLGAPIGIRKTNTDTFPQAIGKTPKADTRTEREKKQEEREEKLLAAARAEEISSIDLAADEQDIDDLEPDINYDDIQWDSDDEEWNRGLRMDSAEDEAIRNVPPPYRYKEEDIEWVISKLGEEESFHSKQLGVEVEALQQVIRSEVEQESAEGSLSEDSFEKLLLSMPDKELIALSDLDDAYSAVAGNMSAMEFAEYAEKIPSLTEEQLRFLMDREREEA